MIVRSRGAPVWVVVLGLFMFSGALCAADKSTGPSSATAATLTFGRQGLSPSLVQGRPERIHARRRQ